MAVLLSEQLTFIFKHHILYFFTKVYFCLWDYYKCNWVFLLFIFICLIVPFHHIHPHLSHDSFVSFSVREKQEDSKALPLPCLMGVVKRRYWNQLSSRGRKYRFFCGPVWHLNRVICFGIIWLGEKGLRLVLSSDILGWDEARKFVVLKDSDIGFISHSLCKLSFWWFVKEVAKVIRIGQPCLFLCRSLCNNWMS